MNISEKHGMEIEYEEMDFNSSDVKTERERMDTKRHQTPQNTVRIRNYRAVAVCLVLTAIIVLCVHIYTNHAEESHQRLTRNAGLTEDRHQLLTKITCLTKQRDQLLNDRDELLRKNDNLTKQNERLHQEKTEQWKCLLDGWIYYQSSIYFISSKMKSWTESRSYCTEKGANLIIINNTEEQDFVKQISAGDKVWIGLTDNDMEGSWKWVDGSMPAYRFWDPREPNGYIREDCALNDSSGWADYPCSDAFKWICEKSLVKCQIP